MEVKKISGKIFRQGNKKAKTEEKGRIAVCDIFRTACQTKLGCGVLVCDQQVKTAEVRKYFIITSSKVIQNKNFGDGEYKVQFWRQSKEPKMIDLKSITKYVNHDVTSGLVVVFVNSGCSKLTHRGKVCSILTNSPLTVADCDQSKDQFCYIARKRYWVDSNGECGEHVLKADNNSTTAESTGAQVAIPNGSVILQGSQEDPQAVGIFNLVDHKRMAISPIWLKASINGILGEL